MISDTWGNFWTALPKSEIASSSYLINPRVSLSPITPVTYSKTTLSFSICLSLSPYLSVNLESSVTLMSSGKLFQGENKRRGCWEEKKKGKSVTWGGEIHFARWEVSRGKSQEGILNQPSVQETVSGCFRERESGKERHRGVLSFSYPSLLPKEMHSPYSDHAFNQLFRQKTKVCTRPWIMEGEKAQRRMVVRNRSIQWQKVSLTQIPSYDRQLRACSG